MITTILYMMVYILECFSGILKNCAAIRLLIPVSQKETKDIKQPEAVLLLGQCSTFPLTLYRWLDRERGLLSFFFALMMLPGADGGVDKAAKEEDKADEQYDSGHATVKSVSFSHTGCLTHKRFLKLCPTSWTVLTLRHIMAKWSILHYVKKSQWIHVLML